MSQREALTAPRSWLAVALPRSGTLLGLLLALLLLSGASGPISQVLWQGMLALVFGISAHATETVLAAFLPGITLGSTAVSPLLRRTPGPVTTDDRPRLEFFRRPFSTSGPRQYLNRGLSGRR